MNTTDFVKCIAVIFCCAVAGQSVIASTNFPMWFWYRTNANSADIKRIFVFTNTYYMSTEQCPSNHLDPDGKNYSHGHTYDPFDFTDPVNNIVVTREKIDFAYDAAYQHPHDSGCGPTFLQNCYSYATDAPTPMDHAGWLQWTTNSSQCEDTGGKMKSFKDGTNDHVVAISATTNINEGSCVITQTKEKCAVSGIYTTYYTVSPGYNETNAVRKRK